MTITIRGIDFQENTNNDMGLEFVNLSHRYGFQCPNWPYFKDVAIERQHYMAKSGVLSQTITTTMHVTTHIDAPAHVVQGTPFIDEVPLPHFFGSGLVVSIPKKKWEQITGDDLEKACGHAIRKNDVLIIDAELKEGRGSLDAVLRRAQVLQKAQQRSGSAHISVPADFPMATLRKAMEAAQGYTPVVVHNELLGPKKYSNKVDVEKLKEYLS